MKLLLGPGILVWFLLNCSLYGADIHDAVAKGDLELVKKLINEGASVNEKNNDSQTPLHLAAQKGRLDIVQFLLEKNADPSSVDNSGSSPLHIAITYRHPAVASFLIKNKSNLTLKNVLGFVPLVLAALFGDAYLVQECLAAGVNPNAKNNEGKTALHFASSFYDDDMTKTLLKHKADPNLVDNSGSTPFHYVGSPAIANLLLSKKVDINKANNEGNTPLHTAALRGRSDIIQYLISAGADSSIKNNKGQTYRDMVTDPKLLLNLPVDEKGNTQLTHAVLDGNIKQIKTLLEEGADPNIGSSKLHITPLHWACQLERPDIVSLLLKYKANPNVQDMYWKTPLHYAVEGKNLKVIELLLKDWADPEIEDKKGKTPYDLAKTKQQRDLIDTIYYGYTKLHNAVRENDFDEVNKILQEKKININAQTYRKATPLHIAVDSNFRKIVEILLQYGADPNVVNASGYTPYQLAIASGMSKLFERYMPAELKFNIVVPKSALVVFEHRDGVIADDVYKALSSRVIAIVNMKLLKEMLYFSDYNKKMRAMLSLPDFSMYINKENDFVVIVPQRTTAQKELKKSYGLKNISPISLNDLFKMIKTRSHDVQDFVAFLNHFESIFDISEPLHISRFILAGHGEADKSIAGIPLASFKLVLNNFARINTEFLYILTCESAGSNLIKIQEDLERTVEAQRAEEFRKEFIAEKFPEVEPSGAEEYRFDAKQTVPVQHGPVSFNFAIALQATTDAVTMETGAMRSFFEKLDFFLKAPRWYFGRPVMTGNIVNIQDVFKALFPQPEVYRLISIRFPGAASFFRAVDLGDMEIITWLRLHKLMLEAKFSKHPFQESQQVKELRENREKLETMYLAESLTGVQEAEEQALIKKIETLEDQIRAKLIINEDIKYVQIFPCDLTDLTIELPTKSAPRIISKIPGKGQHYIGTLKKKISEKDLIKAIHDLISTAFLKPYDNEWSSYGQYYSYYSRSPKAWFINRMIFKDKNHATQIESVIVYVNPGESGLKINVTLLYKYNGKYYISREYGINELIPDILTEPGKRDFMTFKAEAQKIYEQTRASDQALIEATGGNERSSAQDPLFDTQRQAFNRFIKMIG